MCGTIVPAEAHSRLDRRALCARRAGTKKPEPDRGGRPAPAGLPQLGASARTEVRVFALARTLSPERESPPRRATAGNRAAETRDPPLGGGGERAMEIPTRPATQGRIAPNWDSSGGEWSGPGVFERPKSWNGRAFRCTGESALKTERSGLGSRVKTLVWSGAARKAQQLQSRIGAKVPSGGSEE